MFANFGSRLPALTEFAVHTWGFWATLAAIVPPVTLVVARKSRPRFSLVFSTTAGVVMFVVAQCFFSALFIPIVQLGAVAAGTT